MSKLSLCASVAGGLATLPLLAAPATAAAQAGQPGPPPSAAGPATPPAAADTKPSDAIGEVVVTAQRREESLQKTPVAVTALSATDLRNQNIVQLADVGRVTPNLAISASGYTAPTNTVPIIFIRGIGQQDPAINTDPGVPVYVNGVYISKSAGGAIDLPDIGQVEVLRGPQGTLFGKNAVGGALNITTVTPGRNPESRVEVTAGSYDLFQLRGFTNVKLSDTLALTASAAYRKEDGYGDRLASDGSVLGQLGDQRHLSGRVNLAWKPTDKLSVDATIDYTQYHDTATPGQTLIVPSNILNLDNLRIGAPRGQPIAQATSRSGDYDNFSLNKQPARDELSGESVTVGYDLGWAQLKSITAYRQVQQFFSRDADGSAPVYIEISRASDSYQFTQELQLAGKLLDGKIDYIAGFFYLREQGYQIDASVIVPGLFQATRIPNFDIGRTDFETQKLNSYAGYGQATWRLTPSIGLTAGVRYTDERKDDSVRVISPESGITYVSKRFLNDSWSDVTPHFAATWQATDTILAYASATKGFKSGGFNLRPSTLASLTSFEPETLWSYEAGVKSEFFQHRLRANLAYFYSDYDNIQLTRQILGPLGLISDTNNVAAARIQGVEGEFTAVPVRNLILQASFGYTDNEYTEVQPGAVVTSHSQIPYVPQWTTSLSARYAIELPGHGVLTPSVNYAFRSHVYVTPSNTSFSYIPSYGLVSARVAYQPEQGNWELSGYVTNLTDKRYLNSVGDSNGIGIVYQVLGRPREFGVTLGYHF